MKYIIALAFLLVVPAVIADDWFSIELIIFEHREDASSQSERWPMDPGVPAFDGSARLVPVTTPRVLQEFEQLTNAELRLGGTWRTLTQSSRYRPLVHVGWIQVGQPPESSKAVVIDMEAGNRMTPVPLTFDLPEPVIADLELLEEPADAVSAWRELEALDALLEETTGETPWRVAAELRADYDQPPVPERLQGTVRLSLQRFLHVEADLLLTSSQALPEGEEGNWYARRDRILDDLSMDLIGAEEAIARLEALNATPRFLAWRLQESRRVRSTEIHYLDHPKFGLIVTVHPVPREVVAERQQNYENAHERFMQGLTSESR